jgi:hypothetical protein
MWLLARRIHAVEGCKTEADVWCLERTVLRASGIGLTRRSDPVAQWLLQATERRVHLFSNINLAQKYTFESSITEAFATNLTQRKYLRYSMSVCVYTRCSHGT